MRQARRNPTPAMFAAFLWVCCTSAAAQQPLPQSPIEAPPQQPATDAPLPQQPTAEAQQTSPTAIYEDWGVRCATPAGPRGQKLCEMLQDTTTEGRPATQIMIVRPAKSGPYKLLIQVPHNIWLQTGVTLVFDNKDRGIAAMFKWCMPAGCVATADINEGTVKKLRAVTQPGRLQFKTFAQKDVAFPVSFKGFGQAIEAISKN